jgi:hypothetical protein
VGVATKAWIAALESGCSASEQPVVVDMSGLSSCIEFKVAFSSKSFKANEIVRLDVYLRNGTALSFPLSTLSVVTGDDSYKLEWSGTEEVAPSKMFKHSFEFRPVPADVGKAVSVQEVRATIGKKDAFRVVVSTTYPAPVEDLSDSGKRVPALDFFVQPFRPVSLDETDGEAPFESISTQSAVKVDQRDPLMSMVVESKEPMLVGEWFAINVALDNLEAGNCKDVVVSASLVDAQDPILSDTTKITFDRKESEAEQVTTPMSEDGMFNVSASKHMGDVASKKKLSVQLYVRTSTTGVRGIRVETAYSLKTPEVECRSVIEKVLNLETTEPFAIETNFLSLRMKQIQQAFTDETFLLSPKLKSLTPHVLHVVDSWVELRHPVRLEEETPSQLAGCVLYKDSVSRECYPLVVRQKELVSSLDVQEFVLGKYVVKWTREGEEAGGNVTTTTFDLSTVKVCLSSLYATASMPSHGIVRTPLMLKYTLFNRTEKVQEYALNIETSESFMTSGNKQLHFKVSVLDTNLNKMSCWDAIPTQR